ncbi:MAG: amidohydrolase, partial [Halieaceae bacterium]
MLPIFSRLARSKKTIFAQTHPSEFGYRLRVLLVASGLAGAGISSLAAEDEHAWDVMAPPGNWREIPIDTTTTTWSFLDVSPDGKELVFDMLGDIYTVPIEGGNATPLTQGIEWNFQPTFSPDGASIAFISDRDGNDNLWIMDREGGALTKVSSERKHNIHNPAWSPDGQWLAGRKGTVSRRSIPAGEIWLYSAMGGAGVPLVEHPDGDKAQKSIAEPAFTPDGNSLYYSQDVTPGWVWQYNKDSTGELFAIKRLNLETGDTVTVTGGAGGAVRPVPSPDGRLLAFVKRLPDFNSAIYVKDLESGSERMVYATLERDNQETAGSHGNTTAFDWLPTGKELVFWSAGQFHRVDVSTG